MSSPRTTPSSLLHANTYRLETPTYIPSYVLPIASAKLAVEDIRPDARKVVNTETGDVKIYETTLNTLLQQIQDAQSQGIIFQPAKVKGTLGTLADATNFKKLDASGGNDQGQHASTLAQSAHHKEVFGCDLKCKTCDFGDAPRLPSLNKYLKVATAAKPDPTEGPNDITVPCAASGKKVQISIPNNYLTLCEVGVKAGGKWLNLNGMPAKQSSTGWGGAASRAVDGNKNANYGGRSCTHTYRDRGGSWWEVELANVTTIEAVRVTNRADCCSERLNGFGVKVDEKVCASGVPVKRRSSRDGPGTCVGHCSAENKCVANASANSTDCTSCKQLYSNGKAAAKMLHDLLFVPCGSSKDAGKAIVNIGNSRGNTKCVSIAESVTCSSDAGDRGKRVNGDYRNAPDSFTFTMTNTPLQLCAKRTDNRGGWGMRLKVSCSRDLCSNSSNSTTATTA
jgi:hypothetical protein